MTFGSLPRFRVHSSVLGTVTALHPLAFQPFFAYGRCCLAWRLAELLSAAMTESVVATESTVEGEAAESPREQRRKQAPESFPGPRGLVSGCLVGVEGT